MFKAIRTGAAWLVMLVLALVDPLVNVFRRAMRATDIASALPRLIEFAEHPFQRRGYGHAVAGGRGMAIQAAMVLFTLIGSLLTGAPLFGVLGETAVIEDRQKLLDTITEEAAKLQKKYEKTRWDPKDRQRFEALCKEGQELQDELEAETKWRRLEERGRQLREVPEPTLPNARNQYVGKADTPREVAGYVSIGDAVIASDAFQAFAKSGYATGQHAVLQIVGALVGRNVVQGPRGEPLVPLTREMRKQFETFIESKDAKAIPTIGTGVLEPDRIARIPQQTADERLTIRDVISTGQTSASTVEYVRDISGAPDLLEPTAHGSTKPEVDGNWELATAVVRTIAAWMPVQNQQLEDWAQLRGLIDGRMRYGIKRSEEHQILYGSGVAPNIEGILTVAGTQDIALNGRYNAGTHTLIDVVRLGITDVMVAGYQANAVVLHPYDWETILLEKGTDDRYVWAVVTDNNGSRIWGVRAVEAVGAANRATNARNIVVGDWQMGAQLLDRMDLTIQVGLVNDQFIKNMRTILAEERLALPIYAPAAFAYFETAAATS